MNTPTPNQNVKELKDVPKNEKQDDPKKWGVKDDEPVTISQTKLGLVLVVCLLGVFGYLFWEKVKERQLAEKEAAESLEQMAQNDPVNEKDSSGLHVDEHQNSEQHVQDQFPIGKATLTSHEQVTEQQTANSQKQQNDAEDLFAQYQTQMTQDTSKQQDAKQKTAKQQEIANDPFATDFANHKEHKQKPEKKKQDVQEEPTDLWAQFGESDAVVQNTTGEEAVSDSFNQAAQFATELVAQKTEQAFQAAEQATQDLFNFGEEAVGAAQKTVTENVQQTFSPEQQVVIKKRKPAETSQEQKGDFFWGETDSGNTTVVQAEPKHVQQQPAEFDPFATAETEVKPIEQNHAQNTQPQFDPSFFPVEQKQHDKGKTTVVVDSSQQTKVQSANQFPHDAFAQQQTTSKVVQQNQTAQQHDPFAQHQRLPVDYSQSNTTKEPFRFDSSVGSPVQQVGHQEPISVYRVQPGDNYWRISRKVYGTAKYFSSLAEYNKARIPDPNKLQSGMKVLVPKERVLEQRYPQLFKQMGVALNTPDNRKQELPAGFFYNRDGHPMYRVGSEDTLTSIAQKHLGRSSRWIQIYQANRNQLKTPNRLKIGTVLALPADASRISFAPSTSIR